MCSCVQTRGHVTRRSWLKTKQAIIHTSYFINFAVQTSQPLECTVRPCACSELVVKDTSWAVSGVRRQFIGLTGTDEALGTFLTRGALCHRNASVLTRVTNHGTTVRYPESCSLFVGIEGRTHEETQLFGGELLALALRFIVQLRNIQVAHRRIRRTFLGT